MAGPNDVDPGSNLRIPPKYWSKPLHEYSFTEAISILASSFDPRERLPLIRDMFPEVETYKTMPVPPPPHNRRLGLLYVEFNIDNNRMNSIFAGDNLRMSTRYVEAVMKAVERGEKVPPHVLADLKRTDYFNQRSEEHLRRQKTEIAKLLGDEALDIDKLENSMPRIIEFLKLAEASEDKKVSAEAREILSAIMTRKALPGPVPDKPEPEPQSGPRP